MKFIVAIDITNTIFIILAILFAVVSIAYLFLYLSTVYTNSGFSTIIERNGKYLKSTRSGWSFIRPIVDKPVAVVDLREQKVFFNFKTCLLNSDSSYRIRYSMIFSVNDPFAYYYNSSNFEKLLSDFSSFLVINAIDRNSISDPFQLLSIDKNQLLEELNSFGTKHGVYFSDFFIISFEK